MYIVFYNIYYTIMFARLCNSRVITDILCIYIDAKSMYVFIQMIHLSIIIEKHNFICHWFDLVIFWIDEDILHLCYRWENVHKQKSKWSFMHSWSWCSIYKCHTVLRSYSQQVGFFSELVYDAHGIK